MGYSEKDGQVVLTMSREDYKDLMRYAGYAAISYRRQKAARLLNRLNQGNPNYTPYRVGEEKS
jgi:hypothetical protein